MRILPPSRVFIQTVTASVVTAALLGLPNASFAKNNRRQAARPAAKTARQQAGVIAAVTPENAGQPTAATPADERTHDDVPPIAAPQDQTSTNDLTNPTALIQFQDVPETRIGVDPSNVLRLTLNDAIRKAVENNLDIESSKFTVRTSEYDLLAARGAYDPSLSGQFSFLSATSPVTSVFGGGGADFAVNNKILTYNFSFDQLLESGGSIKADFNNTRRRTDATFSTINPIYEPSLGVTFTQPLFRNLKIDSTRRQIKLAKKQLDLTDAQFRQRVIDTIAQVQRAYWDLVYALRNEQIQREAVQLARVQLENNLKQVEAGTLAPIELRSTEANLEERKELVISALQSITTAENTLKNLMLNDPTDPMWSAKVSPIDAADLVPVGTDLPSAIQAAITNRPELEQVKLRTQLKEIDHDFYKNQLKPQIDLFASYSIEGTAGGVVQTPGQPSGVPDRFVGGYGRSLGTLFSNDFRTYQVGVRFSFPIRNEVAEANYGRTQAELRQLDVEQRRTVQSIQVEVRNALQAVDAARQRYEAARASRIAAEAQLRGEEERFRAGLSTNFFVLDRQNQLSSARGREAQALTDYNKAIVDLQRVTGTTMAANNVSVESKD